MFTVIELKTDRENKKQTNVYDVRSLLAEHHVLIHYTFTVCENTIFTEPNTFFSIKNILE